MIKKLSSKNNHILRQTSRIVAVICLLFIVSQSQAQIVDHPYVKDFSAKAIDGKIYVSWTTRAGFSCQDINVEVSRDSTTGYESKGVYFGVCGDVSEKDYTLLVEDPILNTLNYLRLNLGTYGYSYIINVHVIYAEEQVLIVPHPVQKNSILHYKNNLNEKVTISFYSPTGKFLNAKTTRDNKLLISELSLPAGVVIYRIKGEGNINLVGKLIVRP